MVTPDSRKKTRPESPLDSVCFLEVVSPASFVGCGIIVCHTAPPCSGSSLGPPSLGGPTLYTRRSLLNLSFISFYIEAAEGSRTPVTSLGSSGNSRYTTAADSDCRNLFRSIDAGASKIYYHRI